MKLNILKEALNKAPFLYTLMLLRFYAVNKMNANLYTVFMEFNYTHTAKHLFKINKN
jgi:hypothetical protein